MDGVKHLHELFLPSHLQANNRKDQEEIELHIFSLLRKLYCVPGGNLAFDQSKSNPGLTDLTPLDNLILYGFVCGVQTPSMQQFSTCNLLDYKKPSQDRGFWSRSLISTKFAWQLSKVFRTRAQISIDPCQLLFQTWYAVVILFSRSTLTNNKGSSTISAEQIWVSTSGRHSGVLVSGQLSEAHNINANKRSAHTYHELPSLNHPENDVLLLLVWSSDCHGQAILALHAWRYQKMASGCIGG